MGGYQLVELASHRLQPLRWVGVQGRYVRLELLVLALKLGKHLLDEFEQLAQSLDDGVMLKLNNVQICRQLVDDGIGLQREEQAHAGYHLRLGLWL